MFQYRKKSYWIYILDILSIVLSFAVSTQIRYYVLRDYGSVSRHWLMLPVFILSYGVLIAFVQHKRAGRTEMAVRVALLNLGMHCAVVSVYFFLRWTMYVSRKMLVYQYVLCTAQMLLIRLFVYERETSKESISLLIVGDSGASADAAEKAVLRWNYLPNPKIRKIILQHIQDIHKVIDKEELITYYFDGVIINALAFSHEDIKEYLVDTFQEMGVDCLEILPMRFPYEYYCTVGKLDESPDIAYSNAAPKDGRRAVKRFADILGGLIGVVFTGLLLIILGPAIKLDSKGPVFFSQTRIGKNGKRFKIWKFRSMYIDAEERKKDLADQNIMDGHMFKVENDPRITRVGRFIRKTSLDEFPQFINVLKGDMSLVGTRPPTEDEFTSYSGHYRRRLSITPGLTGIWQTSGRNEITDFDEVVGMDLYYIDNWSLILDIKLILKTILVMFSGK